MENSSTILLIDGRLECHPLFNSAVLDNVISWLDIPTLKEVRAVCKFWHQKASPYLQQSTCVKLTTVDYNNLDQFTEYISSIPPYQDVFFRHYDIDSCHMTYANDFPEQFLLRCCSTLNSLTLKYTFFTESFLHELLFIRTPELWNISFENCLFCPETQLNIRPEQFICHKLTSLHFHSSNIFTDRNHDDEENDEDEVILNTTPDTSYKFPIKWLEIFKYFPNLRTLSLNDLNDEENTDLLMSMKETSQNRSTDFQIENLDIFGHKKVSIRSVLYKDWELLSRLRLPFLTVLNMDIGLCVDERGFAKGLANFAPTLQKLQIWRGRIGTQLGGFPYDIRFPRLQILELPENCVNGLRFVNYMRSLQSLTITQCDTHPNSEETTIFNDVNTQKIIPLPTLTYILVEFYMNDVSKIENIFPNILKIFMLDNFTPNCDSSDEEEYENDKNLSPEWKRCKESVLEVSCKDV